MHRTQLADFWPAYTVSRFRRARIGRPRAASGGPSGVRHPSSPGGCFCDLRARVARASCSFSCAVCDARARPPGRCPFARRFERRVRPWRALFLRCARPPRARVPSSSVGVASDGRFFGPAARVLRAVQRPLHCLARERNERGPPTSVFRALAGASSVTRCGGLLVHTCQAHSIAARITCAWHGLGG